MKNGKNIKRLIAGVLALALLSGCDTLDALQPSTVKAGETISENSKWINSDIEGAIDENTAVNLKDDFHTAVNRDWLLENTATKDDPDLGVFVDSEEELYERKKAIILGEELPITNPVISQEQDAHNRQLIREFAEVAGNWEKRDALGIEPIRPYVEAIESIDSLEDMTAYITDVNGMNFEQFSLLDMSLYRTKKAPDTYTLSIAPVTSSVLKSLTQYSAFDTVGFVYKAKTEAEVTYLLERMGYGEKEIKDILKKCYRYEARISDALDACRMEDEEDESDNLFTLAELTEIVKHYPLVAELDAYGLMDEAEYYIELPDYLKQLDKLYQEKYLEEMKACWLVKTIESLLPYLDREAYDKSVEINELLTAAKDDDGEKDEPTGQNPDIEEEEENPDEALLIRNVEEHLTGVLDQIYIARHCTEQEKQEIAAIADAAAEYFSQMLQGAEWLSDEARAAAVEKLDYLKINSVYPDEFVDYRRLSFDLYGAADMVDAVKSIYQFRIEQLMAQVGEKANRDFWDLDVIQTSVCNAYYLPSENSVNILHGILPGFYDENMSQEEKLGKIGAIIGHELTHAFDDYGYQFNKEGQEEEWWSNKDVEAFEIRAHNLQKYYSAITPYPGAELYSGAVVSGEAIADMGGLKCMLGLAENIPDFDYEKFFIAYAENWRCQRVFDVEKGYAGGDEHPLAFLRTNVTLQQFDKFNETFDIQPSDGMYLAPEARISVW